MEGKSAAYRSRYYPALLAVLLVMVLVVASPESVSAEVTVPHFAGCAFNTGSNATINVPADVSINGLLKLESGDEIAVYTANGSLCVGASQSWTGTGAQVFPAWGDNFVTEDVVDGLRDERMQFRIWDQSADQEYIANQATFSQGDGYYAANSIHILESLTVSQDLIYISNTNNGYVDGVKYLDEDILAINLATGITVKYIDFSDVSLTDDIDAFHVKANGDVLFSVLKSVTLPTVGLVEDADVILFSPTSTGDLTAGTFSWYFDGSDVGLDTVYEDIDALTLAPDGRLVISISAASYVPGLSDRVKDEDLIAFTADSASTGTDTSGTWELYFDTGDTEFPASETDINGAWIDPINEDIYFSDIREFNTTSVSGDAADLVRCEPGSFGGASSCSSLSIFADGSTLGLAGFDVDGFSINTSPQPDVPFVTLADNTYVDGIKYLDEDIIAYDGRLGQWYKYIDFSDVSLTGDIDAFVLAPGGDILFSLLKPATLPTVGLVEDADIIRFRPTAVGYVTAGTFSWYFDGSDVGLDTAYEDIDAVALAPDGRLVVSISAASYVPDLTERVKDEDLIAFTADNDSTGTNTAGTWELYFDTGDTEFPASETDINGAWIDPENEDIYFSDIRVFNTTSVSGDAADIVRCVPGSFGSASSCTSLSIYFDGSANGLNGENIDSFSLVLDTGSGAIVQGAPDLLGNSYLLPDDIEDGDGLSRLRRPK